MKGCRLLVVALASVVLSACTVTGTGGRPLVPDKSLNLIAGNSVALSSIATAALWAAAVHVIYDPLAPNWEIEETRLTDDTYRFSMKMKRYHTGGAGESMQIMKRRASQLQYEQGYALYQILEYAEGIDSQTLGARRVAEGTVRLVQRQGADSYLLNGTP